MSGESVFEVNELNATVEDTVNVGFDIAQITSDPTSGTVWATSGDTQIAEISEATDAVITFGGFSGADAIAADPGYGTLWVSESGGAVAKVSESTGAILGTVGGLPSSAVVIATDPARNTVWVAGQGQAWVDEIDPSSDSVVQSYDMPVAGTEWMSIDSESHFIWFTTIDTSTDFSSVVYLNEETGTFSPAFGITYGTPGTVAADPATGSAWLTATPTIAEVRPTDGGLDIVAESGSIEGASALAVDPAQGTVWAAGGGFAYKVNESTGAVSYVIVGNNIDSIAVDPNKSIVWIADGSGDLDEWSEAPSLLSGVDVGTAINGMSVDPDTGTLWLSLFNSGIEEMNESTGTEVTTVPDATSVAIATDPNTSTVWVANTNNTVDEISEASGTIVNTISGIASPTGIATDPSTGLVWVTTSAGTLYGIAEATGGVVRTVNVTGDLKSVATDPATGTAWVAAANGTVSQVTEATGTVTESATSAGTGTAIAVDPDRGLGWTPGGQGTLVVAGQAAPPSGLLPSCVAGQAYSATQTASFAFGSFGWSIAGGSLPSGLTINAQTGTISGTCPATPQGALFTVTATSSLGPVLSSGPIVFQDLPPRIRGPEIYTPNTATFTQGAHGQFVVAGAGFSGIASISVKGTLPSGLSLVDNPDGTAILSGTPNGKAKSYPLTLSARSGRQTATQTFTLVVAPAAVPPAISITSPVTFVRGVSGSYSISTSGFITTPNISASGTLPTGLSLVDNLNGTATLSGIPTSKAATYNVTLIAATGAQKAKEAVPIVVERAPAITSKAT